MTTFDKQVEEIYVRPKLATSNDPKLGLALTEAQTAIMEAMIAAIKSGNTLGHIETRFIFLEVLEKHGYSIVKGIHQIK